MTPQLICSLRMLLNLATRVLLAKVAAPISRCNVIAKDMRPRKAVRDCNRQGVASRPNEVAMGSRPKWSLKSGKNQPTHGLTAKIFATTRSSSHSRCVSGHHRPDPSSAGSW